MSAVLSHSGAALKTASATASPTMPTGLQVGDILLMHANVSSGTISISANSTGWVEIAHLSQSATNIVEGYVWAMRVTNAGMSGPELTRTAGDYMIARIWVVRGADNRGTVEDAIVGSRNTLSGAGVFTLSHTTFDTSADDATVVYIGQTGFDGTGSDMSGDVDDSGSNLLWPAVVAVDGTTTGNGGGYCVATGYKAFAGAVGQLDHTHGSAKSWCKHAFAFRGRVQDLTAPVIAATPASASTIDDDDSIQIDVTDAYAGGLASIDVTAIYPSGASDNVYSSSAFGANYTNGTNAISSITNGNRLVILRDGTGWPETTMVIRVTATDVQGNRAVSDLAYTVTGFFVASAPAVVAVTAEGAIATGDEIEVEATDADGDLADVIITATYGADYVGGAITETIYEDGAFTAPFTAGSDTDAIANGTAFQMVRAGGWPSEDVTIKVTAIDDGARVTIDEFVYTTNFVPDPGDVAEPEITNISPTPGTNIRPQTVFSFDVTDDLALALVLVAVSWRHPKTNELIVELAYDGTAFRGAYRGIANTKITIAGGFRFNVLRDGGWLASPTLEWFPLDTSGNLGVIP
jgi:hypothetical protein